MLGGPANLKAVLIVAAAGLVGAGLWAQYIEGSPRLLRPFGFYGGAAGVAAGSLIAGYFHADPWLIFASFCAAMPWIQGIGRLRCLVQGCCHGSPAPQAVGICYRHPHSRVCRFTRFTGIPVHPTPLYSILWDGLIFLMVIRLWAAGAPLPAIIGVCMILSSIGRFVEEAYRGEPQTVVLAGLRIYQWIATVTVLLGAAITALGPDRAPETLQWNWQALLPALPFAATAALALGVDFPKSNRRFARLT
jgi:prolipoprotein diacylglyceryltransferase